MAAELVVLGGDTVWTRAVVRALRKRFGQIPLIIEHKESIWTMLRRRYRRLGLLAVAGQIAFAAIAKVVRLFFRKQRRQIFERAAIDPRPIADGVVHVASVNDAQTIRQLHEYNPRVIVVSQTRILSRKLLESIPAVFINVHTGILPQYRGNHGAYWALAKGDKENCGVSVHVVDAGVDTGPLIAEARIHPSCSDNYMTYQWLQLEAALPLLLKAVQDALNGELAPYRKARELASEHYYHPTLWSYCWTALRRGVW
jgi:folate-dependent phosphoribosylglycinamide formyltransferase PurN